MSEQFSMKLDKLNKSLVPPQEESKKINIVDTTQYQKDFEEILNYMKSDEMQDLKKINPDMYWNKINLLNDGKVSYKMIDLLDEDFNNEKKIRNMLGILGDCKTGKKDIEEETKKFDDQVSEEFLYPSFGGKDNFLQKIAELENDAKLKNEINETNKKNSKLDNLKKATRVGGRRV